MKYLYILFGNMKKYKTKIAEQHIPNINKVDVYDMDGNVI